MKDIVLPWLTGTCRNRNSVWSPSTNTPQLGDIPMSAFFRSVSASFSTTFCFWAAISSLVFSASLKG